MEECKDSDRKNKSDTFSIEILGTIWTLSIEIPMQEIKLVVAKNKEFKQQDEMKLLTAFGFSGLTAFQSMMC